MGEDGGVVVEVPAGERHDGVVDRGGGLLGRRNRGVGDHLAQADGAEHVAVVSLAPSVYSTRVSPGYSTVRGTCVYNSPRLRLRGGQVGNPMEGCGYCQAENGHELILASQDG
jgi:hypothetical protein